MNIKCLGLQARAPMKLVEGQFCESSLGYKLCYLGIIYVMLYEIPVW